MRSLLVPPTRTVARVSRRAEIAMRFTAGLFSWQVDGDVLRGRQLVFRITPESTERSYLNLMAPSWAHVISEQFDGVHPAVTLMKKVMLGTVLFAAVLATVYWIHLTSLRTV